MESKLNKESLLDNSSSLNSSIASEIDSGNSIEPETRKNLSITNPDALLDKSDKKNNTPNKSDQDFTIPKNKLRLRMDNLEEGRNFLRDRYVERKIKDKKEKLEKMKKESLGFKYTKNQKAVSVVNPLFRQSLGGSNETFDEEKEKTKYKAGYLQLIEKAILSFNLKKYEECYSILYKSFIIDNEEEFGLFLLIQNGLDKSIIGDYLPKYKCPNYDGKVLASFAQSCLFKNKFLDCFRFFLSRVSVPKDANLILVLVEEFSKVYYFDNKDTFPNTSPNDYYLLASTVLALNTMIVRSKDIKNINMIKKEEFCKMNQTLNKDLIAAIYDELNSNPIDIKQDYNEIVYKILSGVVTEKESSYADVKRDVCTHSFYRKKNIYSFDSNLNAFGEYDRQILVNGGEFNYLKNGPNDNNPRYIQINKVYTELQAKKNKSTSSVKASIKVDDIKNVILGTSSLPFKNQLNISLDEHSCYFTIITKTKHYDLYNKDREYTNKFYKALKSLLNFKDADRRKQKNEKEKVIEEKILEIWRKEILVKWSYYRLFTSNASYVFLINEKSISSQINNNTQSQSISIQNIIDKLSILKKDKNQYYSINEFSYLVMRGIPEIIRKEIWTLFIGNPFHLTKNLIEIYLPQIEKVNFKICMELYDEDKTKPITTEYPANQIIKDIIKATKFYKKEFEVLNKLEIMQDTFILVRTFCYLRPDAWYSACLVNICIILLINGFSKDDTFILMSNLVLKSSIMKFLTREQNYISICSMFFKTLLEKYVPEVSTHFQKLEITPSLYFTNWYETIFFRKFNFKNLIKIFNAFVFKGERIIFQAALTLFALQKDDFLILPIGEILQRFKKFSDKVNDDFFDLFEKFNISADYKNWKKENQLAEEKGRLYQFFLNDE